MKERRADLKARPTARVTKLIPTGRTYAQVWAEASEEEGNGILAEEIALLSIRKGKRGGRGPIDMSRVTLLWNPERVPEDATSGPSRIYAEVA